MLPFVVPHFLTRSAVNMIGSIKRDIMKSSEAIEYFKRAAELEPNERGPMDNMLLVMNDIYGLANDVVTQAHCGTFVFASLLRAHR